MLAILTSHPIQYQVPIWRALHANGRVPFRVWYLTDHGLRGDRDPGFARSFSWDVDMLGGYRHDFLAVRPDWDLRQFRGVRLAESLADRICGEGIRVLWVEGWRFQVFWEAVRIAVRRGVSVWLRGESNDLKQDPVWKSAIKRPMLRRHFRRIDQFLCIGEANRRLYRSYGICDDRLQRAPYCVDNDRFAAESQALTHQRSAIRQQWNVPEAAFCILFCGKFITKKRPLDLVNAVQRLNHNGQTLPPVHLLFVGSGQLGADLRRQCCIAFDSDPESTMSRVADDKPQASFVGFLNQTEIAQAYVAADLLVLPSDSGETWGLVANEAMACGTPAAVSNLCGCSEDLVAALDPRLVFRCGDIDGLADAISYARGASLSRQRVQEIADTHHLRHTVATVESLYPQAGGFPTIARGHVALPERPRVVS